MFTVSISLIKCIHSLLYKENMLIQQIPVLMDVNSNVFDNQL